ncbi:aminoglycoside 2''-phosphotransferase [Tumebacillus sp. BK434]|uniref:phosphotransferase n=1 Tax=Tumebacillus sp. BK434 TaxID=2512169 RepID=UPI0010D114F2|nr:phosphotransferase [Tumebacillus sp. BK434]TCP52872.1 aminoglycoside 2''-phosphotransferase [Tumebacillus sp. BK434]
MIEHIFHKHPELRHEGARAISHGWANQVWIVGERLVFRFPRTPLGQRELWQEAQVLPELAGRLPVQVPEFLYRSAPEDEIVYAGYRQINGTPLTAELFSRLTSAEKMNLAVTIGSFLTTLHMHTPNIELPTVKKADWEVFFREIETKAFPLLNREEQVWTQEIFDKFLEDPANFTYRPRLLHGDLSAEHLLVQDGKLTGVIDFGDLRIGDPAYDFVGLYVEYGADFTREVLAHYELPHDGTFWQRVSGFYAGRLPFHSILYGVDTGSESHVQAGLHNLRKGVGFP